MIGRLSPMLQLLILYIPSPPLFFFSFFFLLRRGVFALKQGKKGPLGILDILPGWVIPDIFLLPSSHTTVRACSHCSLAEYRAGEIEGRLTNFQR